MNIHIKKITADRLLIESYLYEMHIKDFILNKDTYIIKNANEEQYNKLIDFSHNLIKIDKLIFVKKAL